MSTTKDILIFARNCGTSTFTKKEIANKLAKHYYHDADRACGEALTKLVRAKVLKRVKNGLYAIDNKSPLFD